MKQCPIVREGFPFIGGGCAATLLLFLGGVEFLAAGAGVLTLFLAWFFRDPKRVIPRAEGLVVSPADGRVIRVEAGREERFLKERAIKVSIFLGLFDVHVNRSPCEGRTRGVYYSPGRFFAAYRERASWENEQNAILLETPSRKKVLCVQVAGLLARRIVCWTSEGDCLERGQRIGLIRFGSRVDLFLPPETELLVKEGNRVKGGETVMGVLR